eukprot:TRINITY_DN21948_c0_g1_i1.p1 TRINITY_DN21948_c0_g1~~TRINITY_DN21948_c0_g1_i1.p1  ORF type:complete len:377 (-),score=101.70 TRINITY_DN21948_c0_g1_i1:57-1145(-)
MASGTKAAEEKDKGKRAADDDEAEIKKRKLAEFKKAALARILAEAQEEKQDGDEASDKPADVKAEAESKPHDDGSKDTKAVPSMKSWDPATGTYVEEEVPEDVKEMMGISTGHGEGGKQQEPVPESFEPPELGDRSIMDFLKQQSESAVGGVLKSLDAKMQDGVCAVAAPVMERRAPKQAKPGTAIVAASSTTASDGGIMSGGRMVGRAAGKSAGGFLSADHRDGGGGVVFARPALSKPKAPAAPARLPVVSADYAKPVQNPSVPKAPGLQSGGPAFAKGGAAPPPASPPSTMKLIPVLGSNNALAAKGGSPAAPHAPPMSKAASWSAPQQAWSGPGQQHWTPAPPAQGWNNAQGWDSWGSW